MRLIPFAWLVSVLTVQTASGQELPKLTGIDKKLEVTAFVDCGQNPPQSRSVRSPILTSPDGAYSASVVVTATASARDDIKCSNVSQLYISHRSGAQNRLVYEFKPSENEEHGNGLRLVDWHPNRHLLAMELHMWVTSGDGVGWIILEIYAADRDQIIRPDLERIFAEYFPKECRTGLDRVLGFTADGKLAITVFEEVDPYEAIDKPPIGCFPKGTELWYLDLDKNTLSRTSQSRPVMRFGTVESARNGPK
jgi:hypothetical protein